MAHIKDGGQATARDCGRRRRKSEAAPALSARRQPPPAATLTMLLACPALTITQRNE
jgi:hypothetical protein